MLSTRMRQVLAASLGGASGLGGASSKKPGGGSASFLAELAWLESGLLGKRPNSTWHVAGAVRGGGGAAAAQGQPQGEVPPRQGVLELLQPAPRPQPLAPPDRCLCLWPLPIYMQAEQEEARSAAREAAPTTQEAAPPTQKTARTTRTGSRRPSGSTMAAPPSPRCVRRWRGSLPGRRSWRRTGGSCKTAWRTTMGTWSTASPPRSGRFEASGPGSGPRSMQRAEDDL